MTRHCAHKRCPNPPVEGKSKCQRCLDRNAAYMRRRYKKRRDANVCIDCGGKRTPGSTHYCSYHLALHAKRQRGLYERRLSGGKCPRCGDPLEEISTLFKPQRGERPWVCANCIDYEIDYYYRRQKCE